MNGFIYVYFINGNRRCRLLIFYHPREAWKALLISYSYTLAGSCPRGA